MLGWFGGPGIAGFTTELQHFGLPSAPPLPLLLAALQTVLGLMVAVGGFTRVAGHALHFHQHRVDLDHGLARVLQQLVQLELLLGGSLGCQWQGEQQAQGRDDKTQHGSLLVR